MTEQLEAGLVSPVQVVEDDHDGSGGAGSIEQADGGGKEEVALGVGVAALWGRQPSEALPEGGHHPRQFPAVGRDMDAQQGLVSVRQEVGERLAERAVWGADLFVATTEENGGLGLMGRRASSETSVVWPCPGSPETRTSSRPAPDATRLAAASRTSRSCSRPMTPTPGR